MSNTLSPFKDLQDIQVYIKFKHQAQFVFISPTDLHLINPLWLFFSCWDMYRDKTLWVSEYTVG